MQTNLFTAAMVIGGAAISLMAVTGSVSAQGFYMPSYEAPWSTPGEYEYQYTQAEGIIPPSYYDYTFAPTNTSGYAMQDYLSGGSYAGGYTGGYASDPYARGQYTNDMFDSGYTQQYYSPQYSSYSQQAAYVQSVQPYVAPYDSVAAAKILNCAPGDVRWRADEVGGVTYYVDGTRANSSTAVSVVKPSCRLTPKATGTGTVILEWVTNNATTAFIDNGIGHVSLGTGGRMVTPQVSSVYTMTVVNEYGSSAQCAANIVVKGTAPVGTQTLTIDQGGVQQLYDANGNLIVTAQPTNGTATAGTTTTPTTGTNGATAGITTSTGTVTYDANGNPIDAVAGEATKVGTNVLEKITGALGSGQSIWERIRVVSMIALGIFIVLAVVVFVMRKMFGGGGEGGH